MIWYTVSTKKATHRLYGEDLQRSNTKIVARVQSPIFEELSLCFSEACPCETQVSYECLHHPEIDMIPKKGLCISIGNYISQSLIFRENCFFFGGCRFLIRVTSDIIWSVFPLFPWRPYSILLPNSLQLKNSTLPPCNLRPTARPSVTRTCFAIMDSSGVILQEKFQAFIFPKYLMYGTSQM